MIMLKRLALRRPRVPGAGRGGRHLIEAALYLEEVFHMLKRAASCLLVALVAALFGFTGLLRWTAMIAQSIFFIFFGLCVLSLLFSLFEAPATPGTREIRLKPDR